MVELKLALLPDRRVNPHVGVAGGLTMARSVRLTAIPSADPDDFEFETRRIIGYVLGLDVVLDRDARWLAFFQIKSLGITYALKRNAIVPGQVLLDQPVKDALNHLVLGIGVRP